MIGTRISQYTVLEKIGEGGMGAVWKARDEKLGRVVALKFLSKVDSSDAKARFTQEARAASSLSHPGIVHIYDIFEHGDQACIAMEFVDGRTLSHVIPAGGLPMREVLRLGTQIADALAAAHKAGVIHRDIKPGNIMVTRDGRAMLLDFGLAKLAEIAAAPDDATQTVGDVRTSAGSILGTVNYMSPEQAQGKAVDPRTDIFSLGAVLYEMATGGKAFHGDTTVSTITAILRDEPKPIAPDPAGLATDVGRVVMQCLRKEPDRRLQTALDVRNALEQLYENIRSGASTIQPAPVRATSSRLWMGAVVAVALVGVGVWAVTRRSPATAPTVESIVIRPFAPQLIGSKSNASFSPDGGSIVVAWDGGTFEAQNVYVLPLDGGKPTRLTRGTDVDGNPFYAPDGTRVFFTRVLQAGPHAFSVPAAGGEVTRIAEGSAQAVSDDGEWLIVSRSAGTGSAPAASGTFVVRLSTGQQRQLLPPFAEFSVGGFSFSPDGRWVYFAQGQVRNAPGTGTAMRVPFAGGEPEVVSLPAIARAGLRIGSARFFGRGRGMAARVFDESAKTQRTYLLKADGTDPVPLPPSVPVGGISADGRRLIASSGYQIRPLYRARAFPIRGEKIAFEKVLDSPRGMDAVRFAPDGSHVVVSDSRTGRQLLYRWNAAFTESTVLFDQPSSVTGSPAYSPDSQWVAFDARVGSPSPDIWIVPASGGEAKRLTDGPAEDNTPCFDATGEWVYLTSDREGDQQLYKVARAGGPQIRVTKGGGFSCQASPDGKYVYYLQSRERGGIWRLELTTGKEEPVLPEYKNRNWKILSDGLYLLDTATNSQISQSRPGTAFFYRFATRKVEPLGFTTPRPIAYTGIDLSRDRKWVYFPMVDAQATDLQLVENLPFK